MFFMRIDGQLRTEIRTVGGPNIDCAVLECAGELSCIWTISDSCRGGAAASLT